MGCVTFLGHQKELSEFLSVFFSQSNSILFLKQICFCLGVCGSVVEACLASMKHSLGSMPCLALQKQNKI